MDWLVNTDGFVPRAVCGDWSAGLRLANMAANAVIAVSYFVIATLILRLWRQRRRDADRGWILLGFAAFIASCGATHLADVVVFYWPAYRLFTAILVATALLSAWTAVPLPGAIQRLLNVPSRQQLNDLNDALHARNAELVRANRALAGDNQAMKSRLCELEELRRSGLWMAAQAQLLGELRDMIRAPVAGDRPGTEVPATEG